MNVERKGRLVDRVAMISGAGSGIGRASALRFASEGATVVVVDIDGDAARATAASIDDAGGRAIARAVDATDTAAVAALLAEVDAELGALDVLFSHVGGSTTRTYRSPAGLDVTDDDLDRVFALNIKTAVMATTLAVPMLARRRGAIVLTASFAALKGGRPVLYGMAKAAIVHYTKSLAVELGPQGIRANCVLPGPIQTEAFRRFVTPEYLEATLARSPLRRLGEPEEVAEVALFLASDEASYVTGTAVSVDGGLHAT